MHSRRLILLRSLPRQALIHPLVHPRDIPLASPSRRLVASNARSSTNISALSGLPRSTDLLEVYRGLVASGEIKWDDEQVRCIMKLRRLLSELEDYEPPLDLLTRLTPSAPRRAQSRRWWGRGSSLSLGSSEQAKGLVRVLSGEEEIANLTTPKGILLTGPPGTGKSLLLSLFFSLLPPRKRRAHYHSFTLSLYRSVFAEAERRRLGIRSGAHEDNMRAVAERGWRAVFARPNGDDSQTIPFVVARDMILQYHVLYFDELQLVDAASAALIRDVLSWYWRLGGVIVSCTNRVPEDLYHHGVQRDRMIGFLDALKSRCDVVHLDGGRDWRQGTLSNAREEGRERVSRWMEIGDEAFERVWANISGNSKPQIVTVYGHRVVIPQTKGHSCRFTFAELCEATLGPADYLSLASTYSTFFIDEVPLLLLRNKNEARRLINLVDALYESRCQLYVRAAAPIADLFFPDAVSDSTISLSHSSSPEHDPLTAEALSETLAPSPTPNVSLYDVRTRAAREAEERRQDRAKGFAQLGIFTGEDERFAYKRAVSRLVQMTAGVKEWEEEVWQPLKEEDRAWEGLSVSEDEAVTSGIEVIGSGRLASMPRREDVHGRKKVGKDDMAAEAGYCRPGGLGPSVLERFEEWEEGEEGEEGESEQERLWDAPPKIGEQHAWGVAQWGPKAGKWGRGSEVYKNERKGNGK